MSKSQQACSEFTLHVVLATFPQNQEQRFHSAVKKFFFETYREEGIKYFNGASNDYYYQNGDQAVPVVYNPLCYHILGNYDVAYIALIDNFKFAQRLFEPRTSGVSEEGNISKIPLQDNLFNSHTFQSFTGIAAQSGAELKEFFYDRLKPQDPIRRHFVGICNLKLNNGFLIGNGKNYLHAVYKLIKKTIADINKDPENHHPVEFQLMQSFAWFEISLLIFTDDAQRIAETIRALRRLEMKDVGDEHKDLMTESLYQCFFPEEDLSRANIFADTHTYVGIHADLVEGKDTFYEDFKRSGLKLSSEVEWRVKPGHMHLLLKELRGQDGSVSQLFKTAEKHFLSGSSDYCMAATFEQPWQNVELIRLVTGKNPRLFEHIRKVKTKLYFEAPEGPPRPDKKVIDMHQSIRKLARPIPAVRDIERRLRAMKVSRQIRSKIIKLFSNYNNGIQDIILFPYLLDFTIFISRLEQTIAASYSNFLLRFDKPEQFLGRIRPEKLEDVLMEMISIFQEGFSIRMLNTYQFEDINDFDLDFNSGIQQLLSAYSTLAFELGNLVYDKDYKYGPIVQLNMKDTVSNDSSINYYVHHLTSPEFIFATLSKEILNIVFHDDEPFQKLLAEYEEIKYRLMSRDQVLRDMDKRFIINLEYFLNDALRYMWTYRMDFDLFYYWFWTYNFQNASLYDEIGILDEGHFEKELFRILFIRRLFTSSGKTPPEVRCPLSELDNYWKRHFQQIESAVERFIDFLDESGLSPKFMSYLHYRFYLLAKRADRDLELTEKADNEAMELYTRLNERYGQKLDYLPHDFVTIMSRRIGAFNKLTGTPEAKIRPGSLLFIEWYMWNYLQEIYDANHRKIDMLRRNWKDGTPMEGNLSYSHEAHLYTVDQTGGLFFDNPQKQNEYFRKSCRVLTDLWHFSMVRKRDFVKAKLKLN